MYGIWVSALFSGLGFRVEGLGFRVEGQLKAKFRDVQTILLGVFW